MLAKVNLFIQKQTLWIAANPKKAILYWLVSLVAAHVL